MRVFQRTLASLACASLFSLPLALSAAEPQADATANINSQQQALIQALSGQFSNFYALTEYPNTVGDYPPLLYTGTPLTLPNGKQAVLVSQYHFDIAGKSRPFNKTPARQQLYAFTAPSDAADAAHITYPVPTQLTADDLTSPATFATLSRLPGCETYWNAATPATDEMHFEGYRAPKRCYFMNTESQSQVHVESIHYVTPEEQKLTESLLDEAGEPLTNMELAGTLVLHPIRFFTLHGAYLPEGANQENDTAWVHIEPAGIVHDHGQRMNLLTQQSQQLIPYQVRVLRLPNKPQHVRVSLYSLGGHTALEEKEVSLEKATDSLELGPLRLTLTPAERERSLD